MSYRENKRHEIESGGYDDFDPNSTENLIDEYDDAYEKLNKAPIGSAEYESAIVQLRMVHEKLYDSQFSLFDNDESEPPF